MPTGAIVGGSAIVGGLISSKASKSAAKTQANAANNASDLTWQQYNQTRNDLMPYMNAGKSELGKYTNYLNSNPYLSGKKQFSASGLPYANGAGNFTFNASNLDQTPGYQFTLQQGMRGVNNSASARGLGLSGAQLKGISDYTTGLADNTYNEQYQNALNAYNSSYNNALSTYNTNYNTAANQANRLYNLVNLGENAASQSGNLGQTAASNAGQLATSGANALAAGTVGSANALTGAINGASNAYLLSSLLGNYGNSGSTYGLYGNGTYS